MPTNIKCPACSRALEIPDELLGKKVKCPACKMIFTATAGASSKPSRPKSTEVVEQRVQRKRPIPRPEEEDEDEEEDEEPRVRKKGVRRREEDEEDEEEDERPRVRRKAIRREDEDEAEEDEEEKEEEEEEQPRRRRPRRRGFRRGMAHHRGGRILTYGILSLICLPFIFGPMAWRQGNEDLEEMDAGRMDPFGEGLTKAGKICGIIGTVLAALAALCGVIEIILSHALKGN